MSHTTFSSLLSRIHVYTTNLFNIGCTLVATGMILERSECTLNMAMNCDILHTTNIAHWMEKKMSTINTARFGKLEGRKELGYVTREGQIGFF